MTGTWSSFLLYFTVEIISLQVL